MCTFEEYLTKIQDIYVMSPLILQTTEQIITLLRLSLFVSFQKVLQGATQQAVQRIK